MHLLVLSAFRPWPPPGGWCADCESQCTFWCSVLSDRSSPGVSCPCCGVSMHLLVLSAFRRLKGLSLIDTLQTSQCTFWCSVLSDLVTTPRTTTSSGPVSMHLLVLSAFRPVGTPIRYMPDTVSMHLLVLSAFRQEGGSMSIASEIRVSMHLLVLSAFRRRGRRRVRGRDHPVSMHLLVLSAFRPGYEKATDGSLVRGSQCTFWCSVLSDCTVCR